MSRSRIVLLVVLAMFTLVADNQSTLAQADANFRSETRQALAALAETLARDNLFPIALPEAQAPGDAYTYSNFWLPESRAKDCFNRLKPQTSAWPEIEQDTISDSSADGRLSLLRLFNMSGAAKYAASIWISFTDVQSRTVTRQQLLKSLRKGDCSYLSDALEAKSVPAFSWRLVTQLFQQAKERPMIVLQRVVEAKRRIVISLADSGGEKLKISNPQEIIRALGFDADPRAKFIDGDAALHLHGSAKGAILIEDTNRVPIAFTPVSLPSVQIAPSLGSSEGLPQAVEWVPSDAEDHGISAPLADWRKELQKATN